MLHFLFRFPLGVEFNKAYRAPWDLTKVQIIRICSINPNLLFQMFCEVQNKQDFEINERMFVFLKTNPLQTYLYRTLKNLNIIKQQ